MGDFEYEGNVEDDNISDSLSNTWPLGGRNVSIYLIDCSPKMFICSPGSEEEDSFSKSMKCVAATVLRKVIANDQDIYGIVLFNTIKTKNSVDFPNIYVFQELERPGAERILELELLIKESSKHNIKDKFGSSTAASIHDILWVCRGLIIGYRSRLGVKNILLFTAEDNPEARDEHKQRQALKAAKDLKEADIDLEVLPLSESFNSNLFYKELLSQGEDEDSENISILVDPSSRFEDLMERVRRYERKQRSLGRIGFTIAPGIEMGIKVFSFIRKATKPSRIKLFKVTNEEVTSQRKEYLETGELLISSDFVKYQTYGGKKIRFTLEETRMISKAYEPGMELLGFKPIKSFKPYMYIRPANFIYPDEVSVKGSRQLFASLLERCLARKVYPIVRLVARLGSSVTWAFLLPQQEVKDEKGFQEKSPGFYVCYLPFADDIRNIELENRTRANSKQVDATKEMIKKLNFAYHPDCFENPEIQTHWRNLEALALNRAYLEPVIDYTVPDYEKIEKKAGKLIDNFKTHVLPSGYDAEIVAKKRPPPKSKSSPKKAKVEANRCDASVEDMARQKKVDKLTVDVLKQWLISKGAKVTSKKKPQLVQDVYDELDIVL